MKIKRIDIVTVIPMFLFILGIIIWINLFLEIKIEIQAIPTLINGITASTSIIVGFFTAFIAITLRGFVKTESRNWEFPVGLMVLLFLPLFSLFITFIDITMGQPESALKVALTGLIAILFACYMVMIYTVEKLSGSK